MQLTQGEFFQFNLQSQIQLIKKDGIFMMKRLVYDTHLVKLYKIYEFYVEVVLKRTSNKVVSIEPVINGKIVEMYDNTA